MTLTVCVLVVLWKLGNELLLSLVSHCLVSTFFVTPNPETEAKPHINCVCVVYRPHTTHTHPSCSHSFVDKIADSPIQESTPFTSSMGVKRCAFLNGPGYLI